MRSLDAIVELLSRHHQRATYGAVAELVGRVPRFVMQGRPRNRLNSWVVSQDTGLPSGYPEPMIHPQIDERDTILTTAAELSAWLEDPR